MSNLKNEKLVITEQNKTYKGFSYYEYKYRVPHENLQQIKDILNNFYSHSDPYSEGIVDSIYYDTSDQLCYDQCLNGDADKVKFRIRGYGDGTFVQIHQKIKALSGVGKYKCAIQPQSMLMGRAPEWHELLPLKNNPNYNSIMANSQCYGMLVPSIRVRYSRARYRTFDYRMTLDTNIEVSSLSNGIPRCINSSFLPDHVLEIKTSELRPLLPFVGLIKLKQISFSKFMLGIKLLDQLD